jgi:hypothetical protein
VTKKLVKMPFCTGSVAWSSEFPDTKCNPGSLFRVLKRIDFPPFVVYFTADDRTVGPNLKTLFPFFELMVCLKIVGSSQPD